MSLKNYGIPDRPCLQTCDTIFWRSRLPLTDGRILWDPRTSAASNEVSGEIGNIKRFCARWADAVSFLCEETSRLHWFRTHTTHNARRTATTTTCDLWPVTWHQQSFVVGQTFIDIVVVVQYVVLRDDMWPPPPPTTTTLLRQSPPPLRLSLPPPCDCNCVFPFLQRL
jgi:hypothetical protein